MILLPADLPRHARRHRRIRLKQKALKMCDFAGTPEPALGAAGRAFKSPRPDQWNQGIVAIFYRTRKSTVVKIVAVAIFKVHQVKKPAGGLGGELFINIRSMCLCRREQPAIELPRADSARRFYANLGLHEE